MSIEKKIISGSTFIFTSKITNLVALFIFSITMARLLGRDIYGLISIAVGFIGVFAIIGDIGLNVAGTRFISMFYAKGQYEDIRTIVRTSFGVKFSLAIILAIICFLGSDAIAEFFNKDVAPLFRIISLIIVCNILGSVFQTVMKGLQRMDFIAISNIIRDIAWIMVSIGLVVNGWGVIGAMWGYLVSAFIWLAVCAFIYIVPLRARLPHKQKPKKEIAKKIRDKLIVFGMPIVIMDITILLYNWTDTFVLAYFRPTWEVSCYNIAFGLVNMVMFIIISVSTTLFPIFSREHALKNEESQKKIYEKVVKLVTVIVYPLLIFIVAFAPVIILVYGVEYLPALSPLLILVIWGFFRPVGNIGSGLLTAKGRQKLVMKITASTAVLNFILNVILIPAYHMEGAAVATTIAFIFGSVAIYLVLRKDYKIVVDGSYVSKSLAASILAGVLGWGVYSAISSLPRIVPEDFSLIILIVKLLISFLIAGIVYLVILKYINIFSKDEFEIIEKLAAEYWVLRPIVSLIK